MKTVITLVGLPGSGKTTLGNMIHKLIGGSRINADEVRKSVSCDLKFSDTDREIQAWRMGAIAAISIMTPPKVGQGADISHLNNTAVVDFVCPTEHTRNIYDWSIRSVLPESVRRFNVWMDTITSEQSRFPDTAKLFQTPLDVDMTVSGWKSPEQLEGIARDIVARLNFF